MGKIKINILDIISIAKKAGEEVLKVYKEDFGIKQKKSETFSSGYSPLTEADEKSNEIIISELKKLYPKIPLLSEEIQKVPYEQRKNWKYFWLIDPLDGTKSFIMKSGEFTINIALIFQQKPILGVVYAPVKNVCYYAFKRQAFKQSSEGIEKLPKQEIHDKLIVIASKEHMNKETKEYIENLNQEYELININSSLKLCAVAEGKADIYPRLGPTMEWDTAAAHAIVNGAGKKVYRYNTDKELIYNNENLLNPWFIVK